MARLARAIAVVAGLGFSLPGAAADGAVELTKANFDQKVFGEGKNAFVKFLAPWCGHCKSMKPAWDKLGVAFKDSTSVLIADVDCTSDDAKSVCSDNDVSGYPTIKYYTAETGKKGEDYDGGRSFDDLEKFTKEKLARRCDPKTKEDCDEKEAAYIDKVAGKGEAYWTKESERLKGMRESDMKDDKKTWLMKRIAILDGLAGSKSEL